nr:hypothetical protein [Lachnospiraceae bacterium]
MKIKAFNSLCAAVMTAVIVLSLPLPVMAAADDLLLSDDAVYEQAEDLPELISAPDEQTTEPEAGSYDTYGTEDVLETED